MEEELAAPSTSAEKTDSVDVDGEAKKLLGLGQKHLVMGDIPAAVNAFQEAASLLGKKYGETADECAEAFFYYGKSLLELARMENGVLGNALEGVQVEEEGEKTEDDSMVESADNIDEEAREELREQVYNAMGEKEESKKSAEESPALTEGGKETGGEDVEMEEVLEGEVVAAGTETKPKEEVEEQAEAAVKQAEPAEEQAEAAPEKEAGAEEQIAAEAAPEEEAGAEEQKADAAEKQAETAVEKAEAAGEQAAVAVEKKVVAEEPVPEAAGEDAAAAVEEKAEVAVKEAGAAVEEKAGSEESVADTAEEQAVGAVEQKEEAAVEKGEEKEEQAEAAVEEKVEDKEEQAEAAPEEKPPKEPEDAQSKETPPVAADATAPGEDGEPFNEMQTEAKVEVGAKGPQEDEKDDLMEAEGAKVEKEEREDLVEEGEETEGSEEDDKENEKAEEDKENESVVEDKSAQESEEDEVGNLELAWDMLELAKVIYKRQETKEAQLLAAQAHLKLGEVSVESENYVQAIEEFQACLTLQQKYLEVHDRLLAETHYQLALAYHYNSQFNEAVLQFSKSVEVIDKRLVMLTERIKKAGGSAQDEKEIEELKGLLPEIKEKIDDSKESQRSAGVAELALKATLVSGTTSGFTQSGGSVSASPIPVRKPADGASQCVSDISHLVRKKRKPEEETQQGDNEAKKSKPEPAVNGGGDAAPSGNEVAEKMEEETEKRPQVEAGAAVESTV
ncbi:PREDICTED: nuclear autoantigenic sperm protein isoform X1 [Gavialis gangeticus]|uniref:nuclear autoantigenic sperm protein isoform X1 n=1 Tax=Gavialis gangeticus TaxID=94835 RepID=UPI00092F7F2B|nr:PREDICTED: nuclear autoantigenic sperm protein isoform X1 [Gavialis gangeticus]